MRDTIIGFDARDMSLSIAAWDDCRKEAALIRKDIIRPLSTDDAVWPSAFDLPVGPDTIILPGWIGPNKPLWQDLSALRQFCAAHAEALYRPYWIAAFTVVEELGFLEYARGLPSNMTLLYLEPTTPLQIQAHWRFLGYDVSDASCLSGLTNCFFALDERQSVGKFVERLNTYHLFSELQDADAFRLYSNARVPEHAPFFVYGLFCVEEVR